jgi:hypothetical protein
VEKHHWGSWNQAVVPIWWYIMQNQHTSYELRNGKFNAKDL